MLGEDKPPILTHFKGFFNSLKKEDEGYFLLPVTTVTGIKRGLMGRRANLSFTSREEVKETHDYGSIYESQIDANENNQAVDMRRRELDNRTKLFIHLPLFSLRLN